MTLYYKLRVETKDIIIGTDQNIDLLEYIMETKFNNSG